jgi:hypothetical protein
MRVTVELDRRMRANHACAERADTHPVYDSRAQAALCCFADWKVVAPVTDSLAGLP